MCCGEHIPVGKRNIRPETGIVLGDALFFTIDFDYACVEIGSFAFVFPIAPRSMRLRIKKKTEAPMAKKTSTMPAIEPLFEDGALSAPGTDCANKSAAK